MNYKLEKFWNSFTDKEDLNKKKMNYKLEKFWNPDNIIITYYIKNEL